MSRELIEKLVEGGDGIVGIRQTDFYKWITSPQGLSELGIPASEPPKLLEAYRKSFKVKTTKTTARLMFGNTADLKAGTPHPAAGQGKLKIQSWMEWALFDKVVSSFGFVPRKDVPRGRQNKIRLRPPLGGYMLEGGALTSSGFWSFPIQFVRYSEEWVKQNRAAIEALVMKKAEELLQRQLSQM